MIKVSSTHVLIEQNLYWMIVEGGIARRSSVRRVSLMPGKKIKIVKWSEEDMEE